MKYLSEDTARAVLVAAVQGNSGQIHFAIQQAVEGLIEADRTLDARANMPTRKDAKAPTVEQLPYPPVTDERAVFEMRRSGDTFTRALAAAWDCGDANNRKRIRTTWADEFRKFATLVHYQDMAREAELASRN
jgi:hypothetical protein